MLRAEYDVDIVFYERLSHDYNMNSLDSWKVRIILLLTRGFRYIVTIMPFQGWLGYGAFLTACFTPSFNGSLRTIVGRCASHYRWDISSFQDLMVLCDAFKE